MTPNIRCGLWLISTSLLLTGCGNDSAEQQWISYHNQVVDQLDISAIERDAPRNIGAFPERQQRLIDIPETRDGMLNIYALRECEITSLIAARNNQLGRVAPPSQHWLYERALWQRLSICWNSEVPDNLSDDNKERLAYLTELKTAQLPAVSWNSVFDSEEWEKSFSRASSALDSAKPVNISGHLAAVDYLQQMVTHQYSYAWQQDSSTLENHLKTLQERPLTAEILRALLLAEQRLSEVNQTLEAQRLSFRGCLKVSEPTWLDTLEQQSQHWLSAINQLINAHPVTPPEAVLEYQTAWLSMDHPSAPWQQFQQAKAEHQRLKNQFNDCALN